MTMTVSAFVSQPAQPPSREEWEELKQQAECRKHPKLSWFVEGMHHEANQERKACIAICNECPIKAQCLEWALSHEDDGVWGGAYERQRRRMRRERRIIKESLSAFQLDARRVYYSEGRDEAPSYLQATAHIRMRGF